MEKKITLLRDETRLLHSFYEIFFLIHWILISKEWEKGRSWDEPNLEYGEFCATLPFFFQIFFIPLFDKILENWQIEKNTWISEYSKQKIEYLSHLHTFRKQLETTGKKDNKFRYCSSLFDHFWICRLIG